MEIILTLIEPFLSIGFYFFTTVDRLIGLELAFIVMATCAGLCVHFSIEKGQSRATNYYKRIWDDGFLSDEELRKKDLSSEEYRSTLEDFASKEFGKIHKSGLAYKDVRIIASETGFSIWFPPELWKKFDVVVHSWLVIVKDKYRNRECWLARGDWAALKIDIGEGKIHESVSSRDPKDYLSFAERFAEKNFFSEDSRVYPDSEHNSIGWGLEHGGIPWRYRLTPIFSFDV